MAEGCSCLPMALKSSIFHHEVFVYPLSRNQLAACNVHDLGFSRLYLERKGFDSVSVEQDYLEINESLTKTTSDYCESKNFMQGYFPKFFFGYFCKCMLLSA